MRIAVPLASMSSLVQTRRQMLSGLSNSVVPVEHMADSLKTLVAFLRVAYDARPRTKPFITDSVQMQKLTIGRDEATELVESLIEDAVNWSHDKIGTVTHSFTNKHSKGLMIVVQPQEVTVSVPGKAMRSESAVQEAGDPKRTAWILVYVVATGKFLMLKRAAKTNNPNLWNFPGGGVDVGDTPVQGAKRELFEEAGIKVKKSELQWINDSNDGQADYFLLVLEKTPRLNVDPKESSKSSWMTMQEIRAKGPKLHRKTAEFINRKINRNLARLAIRRSGVG